MRFGPDGYVYNTPEQTGLKLNYDQGVPIEQGGEGVKGFEGTCGLVSCQNIMRMAGMKISEADVVNYARHTKDPRRVFGRLCTVGSTSENNGGTYCLNRKDILAHYGIQSFVEAPSIEKIGKYVGEGRGVILSVDANVLWNRPSKAIERHAVVVTSVIRDNSPTGSPLKFYICDSGNRKCAMKVDADVLQRALVGDMNVTSQIIR